MRRAPCASERRIDVASIDIKIPLDLWEGDDKSGSIVLWLYPDGAHVQKGTVICDVLVEKATIEFESPESGKLKILMQPEVAFSKGDVIGRIETG
jgi:pyruvate/2-oxoglutarate dehydrogenase complex dihydrolipoamide acyltransferase (E2) component